MKHVSILFLLSFISLFPGCSDDDEWRGDGKPREGILLTLTNGALANTKAPDLGSTANLHHVTEVYAVLYQLDAAGTDGTFKLCKKLDWNPMDSAEYAIDQVQFYQFWFSEESEAQDLSAGNYRVLCIGLDNHLPTPEQQNKIPGEQWPDNQANYHTSGATYNLPNAINGKPLSEALATLAEGKTQEDIAHSELFAGWTDFEYMPGTLSEVQVEMRRRVAGVICYLSDIPYELTIDAATYRVTGVRLCLCQPQNRQIPLCRVETQPDATTTVAADYGSQPFDAAAGSEILAVHSFYKPSVDDAQQLELKKGYTKQANENLYRIENKAFSRPIKENSVLMGAYLLPMQRTDAVKGATLTVQLMGRKIAETGQDGDSNLDANTAEEVIRTLPALNSEQVDGEDERSYNIHPNYIYQIGRKPTPALSQDEYPESLEGNRLFLRVKKWTKEEIPIEFPEVPIYATMDFEIEGMNIDCMGTPWYDDFKGAYPFDKTEAIEYSKLYITPSLLGKPWKLVIEGEGLYIRTTKIGKPLDEEFSKTYEPENFTKPQEIDVLLEDYIVERDYAHDPKYKGIEIANDYRIIKLCLTTFDDDKMENIIHEDSVFLTQYNAITMVGEDGEKRAFARFDLGTEHFASGSFVSNFRMAWGYRGILGTETLGAVHKDRLWWGSFNYIEAKTLANRGWYMSHPEEFVISAMYHAARKRISIQKDAGADVFKLKKLEERESIWYLPSEYEMRDFLSMPKKYASGNPTKAIQQMHLKTYDSNGTEEEKTGIYWSSTPNYGGTSTDKNTAWTFYLHKTGSVSDEQRRDKNDQLFIRQACIMPGKKR